MIIKNNFNYFIKCFCKNLVANDNPSWLIECPNPEQIKSSTTKLFSVKQSRASFVNLTSTI